MQQDENEGLGGTYIMRNGRRELVQRTVEHPEGNRPRDANGAPADVVLPAVPESNAPDAD